MSADQRSPLARLPMRLWIRPFTQPFDEARATGERPYPKRRRARAATPAPPRAVDGRLPTELTHGCMYWSEAISAVASATPRLRPTLVGPERLDLHGRDANRRACFGSRIRGPSGRSTPTTSCRVARCRPLRPVRTADSPSAGRSCATWWPEPGSCTMSATSRSATRSRTSSTASTRSTTTSLPPACGTSGWTRARRSTTLCAAPIFIPRPSGPSASGTAPQSQRPFC